MVNSKQLARQILQRRAAGKSSAGLFFEAGQRGRTFLRQVQAEVSRIQEGRAENLSSQEFALKQKVERGVATRLRARSVGLTPTQLRIQQLREQRLTGKITTGIPKQLTRQQIISDIRARKLPARIERGRIISTETGKRISPEKVFQRQQEIQEGQARLRDIATGDRMSIRKEPSFLERKIFTPLSKGQARLIAEDKARQLEKTGEFKLSLKSEIQVLKDVMRKGNIIGLTAANTTINIAKDIKPAIKNLIEVFKEIKRNPRLIISISKEIPSVLKEEGEQFIELFKTSPTEAIGVIGGNILFFAGTGKVFQIVGRIVGRGAQLIKRAKGTTTGTKVKFIGTQDQIGNRIITKVVFQTNGRQVGGAIGTSVIKGNKIVTQTVGKVGKIKIIKKRKGIRVKRFKQKGVFVGREVQLAKISKRALTIKTKLDIGTITRNLEGLTQVSLGKVASARGKKLLGNVIKFPTGELKRKKVPSLKVDDFVSLSAVLTKEDLSLIVGKTFKNKKDITEFIGLIKGTSIKGTRGMSSGKRLLFKKALQDVAGTISASTPRAKRIIPKLSPKGKRAILNRIGGKIINNKVVIGATTRASLKTIQKAKLRLSIISKQRQKLNTLLREESRLIQRVRLATSTTQRSALKQKLALKTKAVSKSIQKARALGIFIKPTIRPPVTPKPIIILIPKGFTRKTLSKEQPVFFVKIKRAGKILNLTPRPFTLNDAKDFLAYRLDKGLSRSGWFEPLGMAKNVVGLPSSMKGYFRKVSHKLRSFKIRVGKKKAIRNGYIEKKKFIGDTRSEIRALQQARKKKVLKRKVIIKRKVVRRRTKSRRVIKKRFKKKPTKKKRIVKKKKIRRRPIKRRR